MEIKKIIIHEIIKLSKENHSKTVYSDELLPINGDSIELVESLLKSFQSDKILYAEFDDSPGKYFPEKFRDYVVQDRSIGKFIDFTINVVGNLKSFIETKTLSKGGYLVFCEYERNGSNFITVFLIRDTEGQLLKRTSKSYSIEKIEYLDTSNLAMACRINETKYYNTEPNYISFTRHKQQEVSDYFIDWISIKQLESSTEFTNSLYQIINKLPTPIDPETNTEYTIDAVRNMVYETAKNSSQKTINLKNLSLQIYNDEDKILNYAVENEISIDYEFRFDKRALRKFVQLNISKDGIDIKFSRGDLGKKIRLSDESPNIVIIESQKFAQSLREESNSN